jgi:hypothetical protein
VAVGLAVLVIAAVAATAAHHQARLPLAPGVAGTDAVRVLRSIPQFRELSWDRMSVSPVDGRLERVSFYKGARIVAQAAVRANGSVDQLVNFEALPVPYGSPLAYEPGVLLGLAAVFVLMTAVAPLRRLRNLDVAAALSLIAPVVLLQYRYLDASVLAAVPGLGYLLARCAVTALSPSPRPQPPTLPLLEFLTPGWGSARRARWLRTGLIAMVLVFVMVGVSSKDAVDVIYAVMEGATRLIHGVLPYGHLPGDVIHGDTYPILSYALYTPLAALSPVTSTWDSVDLALGVAVVAALASADALLRSVGDRPPVRRRQHDPRTEVAGLRTALSWLAFPPTLIAVSTGTTDVVLAAMVVFAVLLWHRPAVSCTLLTAAGWFKLAPLALLPLWLAPLRGRRLLVAAAGVVGVSAAMVGLLVALGGVSGPLEMIHAVAFQFSRGSPQSMWRVLGIEGLQPLAQAGVIALVAGGAVRLWRDPAIAADRVRMAALSAAVLIGLELSADYWSFLYEVWIVPLIAVSLLVGAVPATASEPEPAEVAVPGLVPAPGR